MELLNIGQKLTLSFVKQNKIVEIISTIDNIYDDRMAIELPTYFMRYIQYLSVGARLTAKVFSKAGTLNFNTVVIKSPLEDEFVIELDRNSIKLESVENIPPVNSIETLIIKNKAGEDINCKTFEISMNTVKFNSNNEFSRNEEIDCRLILPEKFGEISFKAMVTERNLMYDTEYSATFMTATEEARQNLLYYIYAYSQDSTDGND